MIPDKDPSNWAISTWLLALGMATCGGVVNWILRVKQGGSKPFNIIELFGEVFTSGFVGLGVFLILLSYDFSIGLCAVGAGMGGHMGTRLLFLTEKLLESKINKIGSL